MAGTDDSTFVRSALFAFAPTAKGDRLGGGGGEFLQRDMATLPGWTRLGGSAERFRNPEGRVVSRRQYENERAKQAGWSSWSEYQRTRKTPQFQRAIKDAIDKGAIRTRRDVGPTADISRKWNDVLEARRNDAPNLYDPDGPLADYLIYIGRRQPDDWWDVGDTPSGAGK